MDAIVLAGGLNRPDDPLYALTGVEKKALIPLAGRPMINWIVDALSGSGLVEHIVIAGLKPGDASFNHSPVHFVDRVGGIIDNILAAVDRLKKVNLNAKKVLLCNSDIPLITPEIVRGFVADCGDLEADIYYAIVEEKTMETSFPNSKRTYIPFRYGRYTGGDIYLSDISVPDRIDLDLFRMLMSSRKNYLRQARTLGFGFIIKLLLRRATIEETAERARKLIHVDARVVKTPNAELGMDLDKPHQYELIKAILEQRQVRVMNEGV